MLRSLLRRPRWESMGALRALSFEDTIFSLSSGAPPCAISVVRLSGPQSLPITERLTGLSALEPRRAYVSPLRDPRDGSLLDTGVVLFFRGPRSFTGEDVVELQVHGSPAVVSGLHETLSREPGLRAALPGEFTRRAFENGRLNLTEVEGLSSLLSSRTRAQRQQALRESGGELSAVYADWRERLLALLALGETSLNFLEEDRLSVEPMAATRQRLVSLLAETGRFLERSREFQHVFSGLNVVIAGPPNAGKSSLFNRLLRQDRAIVSPIAGTTRDFVSASLQIAGALVNLMDTAGLRAPGDEIEAQGIAKSLERIGESDLCLLVAESPLQVAEARARCASLSSGERPRGSGGWWLVMNKSDQRRGEERSVAVQGFDQHFEVSCSTGDGLEALESALSLEIGRRGAPRASDPILISRPRQRALVAEGREHLQRALARDSVDELWVEDVAQARNCLERIVGALDTEEVLDRVFREFCVGK